MPKQSTKIRPTTVAEKRLARTRAAIAQAGQALKRGLFGNMLASIRYAEAKETATFPYAACVDTAGGVITLNPHRAHDFSTGEWEWAIAHCCMHLAFGHGEGGFHANELLWTHCCDRFCDDFLQNIKIGTPPYALDTDAVRAKSEEELYYLLTESPHLVPAVITTLAGRGQSDIVAGKGDAADWDDGWGGTRRTDWATLLAEGIRQSVRDAVDGAANAFRDESTVKMGQNSFPEAHEARRWTMANLPLLGALATTLTLVTEADVCERRDIAVAAVNAHLGEIYMRGDVGLTGDEVRFVYVHELLHVALLHHTRGLGRDPRTWNFACDFVINGWLVEMNVGQLPALGGLFDPRLVNKTCEEVYDLLLADPKRVRKLRGFRGNLGDVLHEAQGRLIRREDVTTLDDVVRRCLSSGLSMMQGRGALPSGLMEEIQSLFSPPPPWDVELARWMDRHVPRLSDFRRSYSRASRRQASTPDIPRPARFLPQEEIAACTFGVVLDTSGSMDRELLGRALGAIASYAEARDVPTVRLVLCDAAPYDRGYVEPAELWRTFTVQGRGGTVLQKGVGFLTSQPDFPPHAPVMILTDGGCEERIECAREHCFVMPRKFDSFTTPLQTDAPVFRILRERATEEENGSPSRD